MIVCFQFPSPKGANGWQAIPQSLVLHANFTENWKIYVLTRDLSSVCFFSFLWGGGLGLVYKHIFFFLWGGDFGFSGRINNKTGLKTSGPFEVETFVVNMFSSKWIFPSFIKYLFNPDYPQIVNLGDATSKMW